MGAAPFPNANIFVLDQLIAHTKTELKLSFCIRLSVTLNYIFAFHLVLNSGSFGQ